MKSASVFRVALFAICIPLQAQDQQQQSPTKPEPVQEQVTVYATRTEGRLEDQPTRIELLDQRGQ